MIYTLTLSPSLDYRFQCGEIKVGEIMHPHNAEFAPGGKGINVSRCLTKLGVPNIALGFLGGWAGQRVEEMLNSLGVRSDFIKIDGETRINVKVTSDNEETAFNLDGPVISESSINELYSKLDKMSFGDILIISGSTGRIHLSIYDEIITRYSAKVLCVLDAHGTALKEGLKGKPFLIKPNIHELSELIGRDIAIDEVPEVGKKLIADYGITYALVSYGKDGACLISPTGVVKKKFARFDRKVVSTVGAGDCMLASFMYSLSEGKNIEDCLEDAVICGAANCYTGHVPSKEDIAELKR
ncbi:MAG: 1-phosphofructokinase family hexose kinase [Bacilli bacterium]|jgi:1-phosphofructokinase|nr:1-phosphofructokinase family hexose kinase [Bacilli bacterium]